LCLFFSGFISVFVWIAVRAVSPPPPENFAKKSQIAQTKMQKLHKIHQKNGAKIAGSFWLVDTNLVVALSIYKQIW